MILIILNVYIRRNRNGNRRKTKRQKEKQEIWDLDTVVAVADDKRINANKIKIMKWSYETDDDVTYIRSEK